jgi:hypothetical protein
MFDEIGCPSVGVYRLTLIATSFWCIASFVSIKCPSLSHLTNVSLKSTLSDISIATPACFGGATGLVNLLPAFHPKPVFVSANEMGLL